MFRWEKVRAEKQIGVTCPNRRKNEEFFMGGLAGFYAAEFEQASACTKKNSLKELAFSRAMAAGTSYSKIQPREGQALPVEHLAFVGKLMVTRRVSEE